MNIQAARKSLHRGVSLVETIVAIGVLAVVSPLALAALLKAGDTGVGAKAETRSPAIVEACLQEIQVAEKGNSQYLPDLKSGEDFPGGDGVICLAFDRTGAVLGKVEKEAYQKGIGQLNQTDVSYLATLKGELETPTDGSTPLLKVTVAVENPALKPAGSRSRAEFFTKLP